MHRIPNHKIPNHKKIPIKNFFLTKPRILVRLGQVGLGILLSGILCIRNVVRQELCYLGIFRLGTLILETLYLYQTYPLKKILAEIFWWKGCSKGNIGCLVYFQLACVERMTYWGICVISAYNWLLQAASSLGREVGCRV